MLSSSSIKYSIRQFAFLKSLQPKNNLIYSKWTYSRSMSSSYPPHEVVGLPALSPTMTHGTLAKWKLKEGAAITPGDIICDVETDKAVVEYEAQDDMFLAKILIPEGTPDIAVGQAIMITVEAEKDIAAFADYVLKEEAPLPPKLPKEAILPKKEEVPVDKTTRQPALPSDFLISSQTVPSPQAPAPVSSSRVQPIVPQPIVAIQSTSVPAKTNQSLNMDQPLVSGSLRKKQLEYLNLYGETGMFPM